MAEIEHRLDADYTVRIGDAMWEAFCTCGRYRARAASPDVAEARVGQHVGDKKTHS